MKNTGTIAIAGSVKLLDGPTLEKALGDTIYLAIRLIGLQAYFFDSEKSLLEIFGVAGRSAVDELKKALEPYLDSIYAADFTFSPEFIQDVGQDYIRRLVLKDGHWEENSGRIVMEPEYSFLGHCKTALYNYACFDLEATETGYVYDRLADTCGLSDDEIVQLGMSCVISERSA